MTGKLILVATPIGNLGDITLRAIEALRTADLVASEDTRHTGKLLKHLEIDAQLISYHEHNEAKRLPDLIQRLKRGERIALVSDAGTPGISDPGYMIISKAIEEGIEVTTAPGATAFVSACIVSGLPTDSILYGGFLPSRKGERRKKLIEVSKYAATLCFYESPHRIEKAIADCLDILGNRKAAIIRELTKIHEEAIRGCLESLAQELSNEQIKGEIVIVIDRWRAETSQIDSTSQNLSKRIIELEATGLERKKALKLVAKEFGLSRSEAYRILLESPE